MSKIVCVDAVFAGSLHRTYSYFVPAGCAEPEVGDYIVTSFSYGQRDCDDDDIAVNDAKAVTLARVVGVFMTPQPKADKPFLLLLSRREMIERTRARRRFMDWRKRRDEARAKLEAMVKEEAMMEIYAKLAETNPEARALLDLMKEDVK